MNKIRRYKIFFIFYGLLLIGNCVSAQYTRTKTQARYEIDAKRKGVNPTDKDALPRSREFIRLDSTYYVGWMYEGLYKFDRSSDFLGYKNAIIPLQKAFDLLDEDYNKTFHTLYSNLNNLIANFPRYQDLYMIFSALKECYDNLEMPGDAIELVDKIQSYNFRNDYGFELCYQRSWMYHRNRFFTSSDYSFLKNSVEGNEKMAFQWCYNGLTFINKYAADNDAIFGPGQSEQRKLTIYHNLALLHCYNKNYDSSEYYYERLASGGRVSWNNFGGMQSEVGNFATAEQYFNRDMHKSYEHFLREPYYYLPELYVYAGKTKEAINMTQQMISGSGSTPGFGWYNIALARSYLYDGQLDSAEFALNKAAHFKELHIGTTLTQSQYDFTISLLRVQLYDRKLQQEKFLNKGWWYSPRSVYNMASYKAQKMMAEYVVVNQLAGNPERSRLVYDLFCAESTTSFDEAWYLMKDFSPKFFANKYAVYQTKDRRRNIQRYFKLFNAKFEWENGNETGATKDLENMDRSVIADTAHEKLFIARIYESLARAFEGDDNDKFENYTSAVLENYPQLIPFSGLICPLQVSFTGTDDEMTTQVKNDLRDCNIDFNTRSAIAKANIAFTKKGNIYEAVINVKSSTGKIIVNRQRLIFKKATGVGGEIALRLFGKGGALVYERGEQNNK